MKKRSKVAKSRVHSKVRSIHSKSHSNVHSKKHLDKHSGKMRKVGKISAKPSKLKFSVKSLKVKSHAKNSLVRKSHGKKSYDKKLAKVSAKTTAKAPALDMSKIKAEIDQQLKNGNLQSNQAQILEQRAPIEHAVKSISSKDKSANKHKSAKETKLLKSKLFKSKESGSQSKSEFKRQTEFIKTGVPGFDELFEHGIPKGNAVIVAGGAGSGKTIFCLQTIFHHISNGKKCFYMSFEESEEKLIQHMNDFGWNVQPFIKSGKLVIKRLSPFEISRSVEAMLAKEKGELLIDIDPILIPKGFKPDIIALDSLTAIASAFTGKEDSYRIYIEQLFRFFEKLGSTSFLITETKQIPDIFSTTGVEEFLADGVVVLYAIKRGNIRENAVEVLKMRGEKHQKKIVALQISNKGITVFPEQEVFGGLGEEKQ
jgi:KaiC/GvpD/RAD55 family RecA-like ATPase